MERKKYIYFSWQITWSYLWTILKSPLKTWLELINKFNKVVVLNIDIQKSIVFISISSELSRNEIKITTIAIIAPKWINILRNKLNKRASLVPQMVKNLPAMQETQFRFLGQEDSWRRDWLPTLVFLPGEFQGQRSLEGYSSWSHKESDTIEQPTHTHKLDKRKCIKQCWKS